MKKVIASVLSLAMVAALATGCDEGNKPSDPTASQEPGVTQGSDASVSDAPTTTAKRTMTFGTGAEKINLWSFTDEIPKMVGQYVKQVPAFGEKYTIECTIIATAATWLLTCMQLRQLSSSSIHRVTWLSSQLLTRISASM